MIPTNWNDLLITGVYDNSGGSCHYVELFNPTGADIVLDGVYEIGLSNNFPTTTSTPFTFNAGREALTGTVSPYSTFVVRFGSAGDTCNDCPTIVPDDTIEASAFGINGIGSDGVDRIVLIKNLVNVDLWGNDLYAGAGYVYTRTAEVAGVPVTSTAPTMSWDTSHWTSNGTADCFAFQYVPATAPTALLTPLTLDCDIPTNLEITLEVTGGEGYTAGDDTQDLTYQWYYSAPGDTGFTAVTNGATYSGATTDQLTISNLVDVLDYQFYCQVREDTSTCFKASEATRIDVPHSIWRSGAWTNGVPSISELAVIDDDFTTSGVAPQGSFSSCSLVITSGHRLTIDNLTYVEVEHDVIVNGQFYIETQGALVQNDNSGLFVSNVTDNDILITKTTHDLNNWYDYTY